MEDWESSGGGVHIPARRIWPPASVSHAAQQSLARFGAEAPTPMPHHKDLAGWRAYLDEIERTIPPWLDPQVEKHSSSQTQRLGAVDVFVARPKEAECSARVIYNIHGGGLVTGGGERCRLAGMAVANDYAALVYSIDYRMPPDHPYPQPLEDCLEGYLDLLRKYQPDQIIIRGSSAGGNLASALMLRCQRLEITFPAGLILWSPELDLTESGDSFKTLNGVDVVLKASLMSANLLYANGNDLADPDLSPLFGNFIAGFPPTLLVTGTRDMFLSNAVRMHNFLRRAGMHSELVIEEAMPHGGFFGAPEDVLVLNDARDFAERAWQGKLRDGFARRPLG